MTRAKRIRIVSDFDGVFTNQDAEAAAVGAFQLSTVAGAVGDADAAREQVEAARAWVRSHPGTAGWVSAGVLTCYADEDPYVFHEAVAERLYATAPRDVREALAARGHLDHEVFATHCFHNGTEGWRNENPTHLEPDAVGALRELLAEGVEVVVVSNSSTHRVESILTDRGTADFGPGLRLRGSAKKYVVTPDRPEAVPEAAQFGGRRVRLRRGIYFDILQEEKPDVLIGDVLSLDLSLPHALSRAADWAKGMTLVIRRARHTPGWVLDGCGEAGIRVVESFAELPELVRR